MHLKRNLVSPVVYWEVRGWKLEKIDFSPQREEAHCYCSCRVSMKVHQEYSILILLGFNKGTVEVHVPLSS